MLACEWHNWQSGDPPIGCGICLGGILGLGLGGTGAGKILARPIASNPAKRQLVPWQALLEQNEELSLPPALLVSWQPWQVELNAVRCCASHVVSLCESGSPVRTIEMTGAGPPGVPTSGRVWQILHSSRMACLLSAVKCLPS